MKTLKFILVISAILLSRSVYSQIAVTDFTGVTWKVDEYYLNNVKYQNESLDSLRYHFKQNGMLDVRKPQSTEGVTLSYTFNPVESVITIQDENSEEIIFTIVYASDANFVFLTSRNDETTGELLSSEFRMVPE